MISQVLHKLAPVALLLTLACQPKATDPVYGPWEEGLTMAFEDPSLPESQRSPERVQVRVARAAMGTGTSNTVQLDITTLRGHMSVLAKHDKGGIALVAEDGRVLSRSLPEGFPATATWVDRDTRYQVIGRAAWNGAAILPSTSDPVGVWVEARPAQGPHRRTLYLPNLGEVESLEERGGTWVSVNRLVACRFQDLPFTPRS